MSHSYVSNYEFIGGIPRRISEVGGQFPPEIADFPASLAYVRRRAGVPQFGNEAIAVRYLVDAATVHETAETIEVEYFSKPRNQYSVRVIHHRRTGRWETVKLRDGKPIRYSDGPDYALAMLHTTMGGAEFDE